jgi:hypothetical protein
MVAQVDAVFSQLSLESSSLHAKFREFCRDGLAMRGRADVLIDEQNLSVRADVERPA